MKADYKNWMPKGMVMGTGCGMFMNKWESTWMGLSG